MNLFFLLWIVICVIGSLMMIIDKYNSIHRKTKRISERSLILVACFGAAMFMWVIMYLIHHKTKHPKFIFGLPLIASVQLLCLFICFCLQ